LVNPCHAGQRHHLERIGKGSSLVCPSVERLAAYGEPVEGTPFGRYRLIELLGRGGMGEVWRAHDTVTDRVVAIKVLPAHLSEDEDFQRRFRREAHAAARLDTPHVVPIYDYGEIDGRLFVSMRLIVGRDLGNVLADGPLDPARAVRIIDQVASALHAAHEVGLLHRDIKPSNILLGRDDFAYLIDFGIARAMDETRMTKSGNTIGTFAYIAPERLDPRTEEDARADIYSLACVLYEALAGQPPFAGTTTAHRLAPRSQGGHGSPAGHRHRLSRPRLLGRWPRCGARRACYAAPLKRPCQTTPVSDMRSKPKIHRTMRCRRDADPLTDPPNIL
jgi:serine/threonine protein kinase